MSAEPWNVDDKADSLDALTRAYDALSDVVDIADEMGDEAALSRAERARDIVNGLVTTIEVER